MQRNRSRVVCVPPQHGVLSDPLEERGKLQTGKNLVIAINESGFSEAQKRQTRAPPLCWQSISDFFFNKNTQDPNSSGKLPDNIKFLIKKTFSVNKDPTVIIKKIHYQRDFRKMFREILTAPAGEGLQGKMGGASNIIAIRAKG